MLADYERYLTAAREYPNIQGLRLIPLGLVILIIAPQALDINWLGGQGDCTFTLPLLFAALLSWVLLGRYYARTFGEVTPRVSRARRMIEALVFAGVPLAALMLENVIFRLDPTLALSPVQVILCVLFLAAGAASRRWYYVVFGIILAGLSLLPLLTRTSVADPVYGTFGLVFSLVFGLGVILAGLLDHLRLLRYFQPA